MHQVPWELRLFKSPAEIALIRRAAELLDQTLQEIIPMLSPGVTARDVAATARLRLAELGADPAHLGYVAAARGWDFLHAQSEESPLEAGEWLHLELVARYRGYEARLIRCVGLGPIDAERRHAARPTEAGDKKQDHKFANASHARRAGGEERGVGSRVRAACPESHERNGGGGIHRSRPGSDRSPNHRGQNHLTRKASIASPAPQ